MPKNDGIAADTSIQLSQSHDSLRNGETVEMTKNLSTWTLIAIAFNVCNSWAGLAGSMGVALIQGGPVSLVYGFLLSSSLYGCIALTMAELACVYPTAGGQYHFVSILAPSKYYRSLSYTCGMVTNFSWIAIGAAINMIFSEQLITLIMFYHPTFVPHPWHQFLLYQCFGLVILLYNLLALKKLPVTHYLGCKSLSVSTICFDTIIFMLLTTPISLSLHLCLLWFILCYAHPILTKSTFKFCVDYIHQPDWLARWSLLHV